MKFIKKLGKNIRGVVIASKGAFKHEILPSGKTLFKKHIKVVKYHKKPVKQLRKEAGYS